MLPLCIAAFDLCHLSTLLQLVRHVETQLCEFMSPEEEGVFDTRTVSARTPVGVIHSGNVASFLIASLSPPYHTIRFLIVSLSPPACVPRVQYII